MTTITAIEAIELAIPFDRANEGWRKLDFCLVKVTTEDGLTGWGDAFAYHCRRAVAAMVRDFFAPMLLGRDSREIARLNHEMQQRSHLWGRYGITTFALSGVDIALWDLAGKRAGLPLCTLLGGAPRQVEAYASLFRLRREDLVLADIENALGEGYRIIKLHEVDPVIIAAAREAVGEGYPLMTDVNCPWTFEEALGVALAMEPYDLHWLEEPIFPPEDFRSLRRLHEATGIPLAAGENWCTSFQFQAALEAGAVQFVQPSVTKVGGITELRKVQALGEAHGVQVCPHSPYFGPGFLATLHLAASQPAPPPIERFYMTPEAQPMGPWADVKDGHFTTPDGPGLGAHPDPEVVERYRVG